MKKSIDYLITHSGPMHADEVCAAAILDKIFPDTDIVRTREPRVINDLLDRAIVFDVGGVINPENLQFDHHMRDARRREDGTKYSSFGLIWDRYGKQYLTRLGIDAEFVDETHRIVDASIVKPIDMVDNGHMSPAEMGIAAGISLTSLIYGFNQGIGSNERMQDAAFLRARDVVSSVLSAQCEFIANDLLARKIVRRDLEAQRHNQIAFLSINGNAQIVLDEMPETSILLTVTQREGGDYGMTVLRESNDSYVNKINFPQEWAGLSGKELQEASGIPDLEFCHAGRFFLVAKTKEAILEAARKTLEAHVSFGMDPSP